jgi:hypothetical protein
MIQKTNAAYLELHTYTTPVDRKTLKVLFQMTRVIVVVARLR